LDKNKKIFKDNNIINNKIVSFQRQKDKKILEFNLFEDEMIFKDANKAYLQDEHNNNGKNFCIFCFSCSLFVELI